MSRIVAGTRNTVINLTRFFLKEKALGFPIPELVENFRQPSRLVNLKLLEKMEDIQYVIIGRRIA